MKVLHLISGGDVGGAKTHVLSLLHGLGKTEQVRLVCFREGEFAEDARKLGIDTVKLAQQMQKDGPAAIISALPLPAPWHCTRISSAYTILHASWTRSCSARCCAFCGTWPTARPP